MQPRYPSAAKGKLLKFQSRLPGEEVSLRLKPEQDFLSILLWLMLLFFLFQGFYSGLPSALAWVGLGAFMLVIKKKLPIRLLLLMEAPVFAAIIAYSVSPIHLAVEGVNYDMNELHRMSEVSWIAWFGMLAFSIGLVLVIKWYKMSDSRQVISVSLKQAVSITLVGFFCNEVLVGRVSVTIWTAIYVLGYCSPIGLFLIFKILSEQDPDWMRTWKFVFWLGSLILWALHSVTGGIFGSTILILMLFSSEYTQKSKVVLVSVIIFAFIMAPLLQSAKADYRKKISEDVRQKEKKLYEVFSDNFKRVFVEGEAGAYREGIINLADRLCTFEVWSLVKNHMDKYQDFTDGETIKDSLVDGFIPRAVWGFIFEGQKPMRGGSSMLARKYAEMLIVDNTSVGVGVISEFYINAGFSGVLVGMVLLGALGGLILGFGVNDRVQPLGLGMCIVVFSLFVRPEANFSDMIGGIIRLLFLWWVIRKFILTGERKGQLTHLRGRRAGL